MTDFYNNQIECLIEKNKNMRQERNYHYTNSLLLPTDNQLLAKIAASVPGVQQEQIDPGYTPPYRPPPDVGTGQDEYQNQRPDSRVPVEEPQPPPKKKVPSQRERGVRVGAKDKHSQWIAKNVVADMKHTGKERGSPYHNMEDLDSDQTRTIIGGQDETGRLYELGVYPPKNNGEKHPLTGGFRKAVPSGRDKTQVGRDFNDELAIQKALKNDGIYTDKRGDKHPFTYDFRFIHYEEPDVQAAIKDHNSAVRKAFNEGKPFSNKKWREEYYGMRGAAGAAPVDEDDDDGQLQRAARNLAPSLTVKKSLRGEKKKAQELRRRRR